MKVTFTWIEEVRYESTVEVPDAEYQAWADRHFPADMYPDQQVTETVLDFLRGNEDVWLGEATPAEDFVAVDQRDVIEVTGIER